MAATDPAKPETSREVLSVLGRPPLSVRHRALPTLIAIWPHGGYGFPAPLLADVRTKTAMLSFQIAPCLELLNRQAQRSAMPLLLSWLAEIADATLVLVDDSASCTDLGLLIAHPQLRMRLLAVLHTHAIGPALLRSQALELLERESAYATIRCDTPEISLCHEQLARQLHAIKPRRQSSSPLVGVNHMPGRPLLGLLHQLAVVLAPVSQAELVACARWLQPALSARDVDRALQLVLAMQWLEQLPDRAARYRPRPGLPVCNGDLAGRQWRQLQRLRLHVMANRLRHTRQRDGDRGYGHVAA